jgi:hypothetical protein
MVPLPTVASARLRSHFQDVRLQFERDRAAGLAGVVLPEGLSRKWTRFRNCWAIAM